MPSPLSCPQVHDGDSTGSHSDSGESHVGEPPHKKRSREVPSNSRPRGGNRRGIRARSKAGRRKVSSSTTGTTGDVEVEEQPHFTFDYPDENMNILPPFTPCHPSGIRFEDQSCVMA